ncbi:MULTISPECIES: FMN-dependent NADH-azoreductase [Enterobacter]|uniref:FMN-dependent NADH-azoreductase n=1 Tax=Enterobacter TaxID=547 RepID=UPI0004A73220|nr:MULTISPECIES: NAD(P)H-dependent oxidoreductase [Enterobacter]KTI00679.1 FMN-dependent NADH-azoreductase [Enterobacter cloacae subsp. cloacae]MCM2489666.1 NAD(P)H-dependent oxidoreductase [Enterobacter cloacae]MCM7135663.1 NAD(P)H-dependent oxidoreductase [Enterobacter cloacae]CZV24411.1 acyl carrier protein phosphodiesterase [Enterobacter cloacae]HAS0824340.1 FMN-dependent NADH-azoreductase [Enterobacter cloacae subsp. cloacae]
MKILHLDSSINYEFSVTRQLSAETVKQLMATSQGNQLTYRDLVKDEISHLTGEIAAEFRPVTGRPATITRLDSERELSNALVSEFLESDVIVIGAPMYNFSVPSQLKAWMDRIAQPGKTFSYTPTGPVGLAGEKRVIIASARGGFYAGTAFEEMDFQEQFLRKFLGFLGISNVVFVRAEGASKGEEVKLRELSRAFSLIPQAINTVSAAKE